MSAEKPVQISIGATLAASLGAAVRGAQAQLGQLGSTLSELGNKQSGIRQLETMRAQAADAARTMRAAQQRVAASVAPMLICTGFSALMGLPHAGGAADKRRASVNASTRSLTSRASNSDRGQWV